MHSIRPSPFLTAHVLAVALFAAGFATAQRDYAWTNNLAVAPAGTQSGAVVADPTPGSATFAALLFARSTGTYAWNGATSTFTQLSTRGIGARFAAISGVRLTTSISGLIAFGGVTASGAVTGTTSLFNTAPGFPVTWQALQPVSSPPARQGAAIAMDPAGTPVLFGGVDASGAFLSDTWQLGLDSLGRPKWFQNLVATVPPARANAAMCNIGGFLMLQGGRNAALLNDTWLYDGTNWQNVSGAVRPPAGIGAVSFDATRNEVLHIDHVSGTTSRFRVATGKWNALPTASEPLSPAFASTVTGLAEYMAFDPVRLEHVFVDQSAGVAVLSPSDVVKVASQPGTCATPLDLSLKSGRHRLGQVYQMAVRGALPFGGVTLSLGNTAAVPPIALGSGCVGFFTNVIASTAATADGAGNASFAVLTPNVPSLIGAFFDHQAVDVLLNASHDIAVQLGR